MSKIFEYGFTLAAVFSIAACSGEATEPVPDVTGKWCGATVASAAECQGDEVGYLDIVQTGDRVTGKACEAYEKDCMVLQDARVQGKELTFFYTFLEYRVDAKLAISRDTLSGSYVSDKCNCEIPFTFNRVR
ncbi:MAG TPA: hypothetical protein VFQ61_28360 [Polyangiaceae bacterium]|nr:hypothetical protein [Polyangiaceae bacterium]